MKFGVFEIGYTTVSVYEDKTEANKLCEYLNEKHKTNKYYVKKIKR